jgi:hypothetical protein
MPRIGDVEVISILLPQLTGPSVNRVFPMLGMLVFGGLLAVILVCLARKEDRPHAIPAAAELLAVLLPWPCGRGQ